MAAGDAPPQPPPNTDKIIPFSIPNKVTIKLDLEKHNYNSWSSFSVIHFGSLGLKSHVEDDTASTNPDWCQLDDLIKMWILSSLYNRAINLDNELRSIKIGTMTVNEYCTKIRSMADRLKNLGCEVSDKNLVTYTVNGLDSRFATLVDIIRHCETLSSFETIRNMLLLKESSFKDDTKTSSTTALSHAGVWNTAGIQHRDSAPNVSSYRPSYNSTAGPTTFYTGPVHYSSQPHPLVHQPAQQAQFLQPQSTHQPGILGPPPSQETTLPSAFSTMTLQDLTWNMDTGSSSHLNSNASNLRTVFNQRLFPSVHVGDGNSFPVINTSHCTILSAHHPLHLHNVLVTPNIIKNLIFVRQFTRDNNCTIEFDAFGFSVKDFWTRHILLRCDSLGDLYLVTKPSPLPTAFVTTSSSTWHQRLGYLGDDVLRTLSTRNFISCNKTKTSHVFMHVNLANMSSSHFKVLFLLLVIVLILYISTCGLPLLLALVVSNTMFCFLIIFPIIFGYTPLSFWDYALESATRILNMIPTKKVDKTPYELRYKKVPNLSYLKVWGCKALVKRDTSDKLQQRSVKCIFIGYPKETMGYYFYSHLKTKLLLQGFEPPQEEVILIRWSGRTHRAPNRLCLNVEVEEHSLGYLNEPTSYKAAMLDLESKKWLDAMNAEMQSVIDNIVWVLVVLPPNCKTVRREATLILGIKIYRDMLKRLIGLSQNAYMDKIFKRYRMDNSKRSYIPMQERIDLNKTQGDSTPEEVKRMRNVPYASAMGSIMYAIRCTIPDVAFAQNITIDWKSSKQMCATKAEYVVASKAAMEAV
nr:hypothetical protein [Tanacetum cinerariifolium]